MRTEKESSLGAEKFQGLYHNDGELMFIWCPVYRARVYRPGEFENAGECPNAHLHGSAGGSVTGAKRSKAAWHFSTTPTRQQVFRLRFELDLTRPSVKSNILQLILEPIEMGSNNLPTRLTSFIGREQEQVEVQRLVAASRLVTLTGAGGCGKTRLALHVAHTVVNSFTDGAWFVELATLREPALVPQFVAQALGLRQAPNQPLLESLLNSVQSKQMLLILDNCEHLRDACAQLTQSLLSAAPHLRILATGREPLAIAGEMIYQVPGLALPSVGAEFRVPSGESADPHSPDNRSFSLQQLTQFDGIQLFVERARAILIEFTLTSENAIAVVDICRRLDGIPLAIELASARVNVLTVQQIAARLDNRFALLTSGPRTALVPHHHTLHAAIDWSYALLTPEEQTLLQRLAVFEAGCTLDTAEAVCASDGIEREQVLELLSSIVSKSLVVAETLTRTQARYRLLETIRDYALEKLNVSGEAARLRNRHLDLFLARAEEAAPKLHGAYQNLWLNWLESEHDNLRSALAWSLESRRIEAGLRLANALSDFWYMRGFSREGRTWLERLLAQASDEISAIVRAKAIVYAGRIAGLLGDWAVAKERGQEAFDLCEAAGDEAKPVLAFALGNLGGEAWASGDYLTADSYFERSNELHREMGDKQSLCLGLLVQAPTAISMGKYASARALLEEGLSLAREIGDSYRAALILDYLGDVARCEQDYGRAQAAYEQSLSSLNEIGAARDTAGVLHNLAHTHLHQGEVERALALFSESMRLQRAQGNPEGIAECLTGFAALATVRGRPADAARLLAATVQLGGRNAAPLWPAERVEYEHYLSSVRAQLTDKEFEVAQGKGRTLTMEQAMEYALSLPLAPATTAQNAKPQLGGLTARESTVATLITEGRSNREIADELVVSKRTVEKHIANILSKLGFTSRAQIVRWAIEKGLTNTSA